MMARTREEVVRDQLVRTEVDWAKAVRELRELLLGLAAHVDALEQRLAKLEGPGGPAPPERR
jgi:hypothetical protein